jgi:hypothetical protein
MNDWRTGSHYPGLVLKLDSLDLSRVGNCWMKGRLHKDDLIICIGHSGDCFWTYELVDYGSHISVPGREGTYPSYCRIPASSFGAYVLGSPHTEQPSIREFHLFMAGEHTLFTDKGIINE